MLDSEALKHYLSNRDCFISLQTINPIHIQTAGGTIYNCGKVDIILNLSCGSIRITDVIHVPKMAKNKNLIGIGQLETKGLKFTFENGQCYVWQTGYL